jgi:hypothetical protein
MIIFTNKGEILNEPNFGEIYKLLHETRLSATSIEGDLSTDCWLYSRNWWVGYELSVEFFDDLTRHIEYMVISFTIQGYDVYATIS